MDDSKSKPSKIKAFENSRIFEVEENQRFSEPPKSKILEDFERKSY